MFDDRSWIKTYRSILNWQWHDDPSMLSVWIHLLCMASYEDVFSRGRLVSRGHVAVTVGQLSNIVGISVQQVRTCLRRLQRTGEITVIATNRFSDITICNYGKYQQKTESDNNQATNHQQTDNMLTTNHQQTDNMLTTNCQQSDNMLTTCYQQPLKEENKIKNIEEKEEEKEAAEVCAYAHEAVAAAAEGENFFEKKKKEASKEEGLLWLSKCWNEVAGGTFNRICDLTEANPERMHYARLIVDQFGKEEVIRAIQKIPAARYLAMPSVKRYVTFDWFFGRDQSHFEKLMNGMYDEIYKPEDHGRQGNGRRPEIEPIAPAEEFIEIL